jgi:large subunit ribosomal protein L13
MSSIAQSTFSPSGVSAGSERWWLVDAEGETLGRLAVNIARVLRGKHRPDYTPHALGADHVVVVNARGLKVTGKKRTEKIYDRYTGYPGGRRERTYAEVVDRDATAPLRLAVRGMLQHNTLGELQAKRLKVYADGDHPHQAQRPVAVRFGECGEVLPL